MVFACVLVLFFVDVVCVCSLIVVAFLYFCCGLCLSYFCVCLFVCVGLLSCLFVCCCCYVCFSCFFVIDGCFCFGWGGA